jgi:hypothetical protein
MLNMLPAKLYYAFSSFAPAAPAPSADITSVVIFAIGYIGLFGYLWNLAILDPYKPTPKETTEHTPLPQLPLTPAFEPQTPPLLPMTPPLLPMTPALAPMDPPEELDIAYSQGSGGSGGSAGSGGSPDMPASRTLTKRQTKIYRITSLSIQQVKDKILADPTNVYLKNLLLKKLEAKGEQKCVASYSKIDKYTGMDLVQRITLPITASNFTISTGHNEKLRIHLTKAALNQIKKKNSHLKNLKVYE